MHVFGGKLQIIVESLFIGWDRLLVSGQEFFQISMWEGGIYSCSPL